MKAAVPIVLMAEILVSCAGDRNRSRQMFPDCTQVSAEEQRQGKSV